MPSEDDWGARKGLSRFAVSIASRAGVTAVFIDFGSTFVVKELSSHHPDLAECISFSAHTVQLVIGSLPESFFC